MALFGGFSSDMGFGCDMSFGSRSRTSYENFGKFATFPVPEFIKSSLNKKNPSYMPIFSETKPILHISYEHATRSSGNLKRDATVIRYLLDKGADPNIVYKNKTLLDLVIENLTFYADGSGPIDPSPLNFELEHLVQLFNILVIKYGGITTKSKDTINILKSKWFSRDVDSDDRIFPASLSSFSRALDVVLCRVEKAETHDIYNKYEDDQGNKIISFMDPREFRLKFL